MEEACFGRYSTYNIVAFLFNGFGEDPLENIPLCFGQNVDFRLVTFSSDPRQCPRNEKSNMKLSKKLYVTLKERLLQNSFEILLKTLKFGFVCVFVIVRDALSCFKEGFGSNQAPKYKTFVYN